AVVGEACPQANCDVAGSAAPPTNRCKKLRRRSFITSYLFASEYARSTTDGLATTQGAKLEWLLVVFERRECHLYKIAHHRIAAHAPDSEVEYASQWSESRFGGW